MEREVKGVHLDTTTGLAIIRGGNLNSAVPPLPPL